MLEESVQACPKFLVQNSAEAKPQQEEKPGYRAVWGHETKGEQYVVVAAKVAQPAWWHPTTFPNPLTPRKWANIAMHTLNPR